MLLAARHAVSLDDEVRWASLSIPRQLVYCVAAVTGHAGSTHGKCSLRACTQPRKPLSGFLFFSLVTSATGRIDDGCGPDGTMSPFQGELYQGENGVGDNLQGVQLWMTRYPYVTLSAGRFVQQAQLGDEDLCEAADRFLLHSSKTCDPKSLQ